MMANPEIDRAEAAILSILEEEARPVTPAYVYQRLDREQKIDESIARGAVSYLLDRNKIEFTLEQLLTSAAHQRTAAFASR
jgi:hypothetical protein